MTAPESHPDFDALAELDEGLLAPDAAATLRAHVADCAECAAAVGRLTEARVALRGMPLVAMPPEVAARIDAALEAEAPAPARPAAGSTIVPFASRRRPRGVGLAGAAAAAAVVLLVAGVVAGALHIGRTNVTGKGTALKATPTTGRFVATSTGRNYTAATLPAGVATLLGATPAPSQQALDRGAATSSSGAGVGGGTASALSPGAAPQHAPPMTFASELSRLQTQPAALLNCIAALSGKATPVTVPLAVDFARYDGKPAVIVVLPTEGNPAKADVWVVGPGCSTKDAQLRYFVRVAR